MKMNTYGKPVEIVAQEKGVFASLAFFFDSDWVYPMTCLVRERLGLTNLFEYKTFNYEQFEQNATWKPTKEEYYVFMRREMTGIRDPDDKYLSLGWEETIELDPELSRYLTNYYLSRIWTDILNSSQRTDIFRYPLIKGVLCGRVEQIDFKGVTIGGRNDEIERDRKWYWQNKYENISQNQIAKLNDAEEKAIQKAIKRYEKKLKRNNPTFNSR